MTFKDLLKKLQKLTPEQLNQEVIFVRYGAGDDYDWPGLAEDDYYEDSHRVRLEVEHDTVYYVQADFTGVADGEIDPKEVEESPECFTEIVPANMPFFSINDVI